MNISKKALKYSKLFETKTNQNGTTYVVIPLEGDKNYNEKLYNAIREAHGDRFPDDWIYSTFANLLEKLTEYELNTIDDLENVRSEVVDSQVDIYTSDLTAWLNEDNRNVYYLTNAYEDYKPVDGFEALTIAQSIAIDEVMQSVINLLSK